MLHEKIITDHDFKGGVDISSEQFYEDVNKSKGALLNRIMKERTRLEMRGLFFPVNHQFYNTFNRKIQQCVTGGIIDHLRSNWTKYLEHKRYAHLYTVHPKVLTLQTLEAGFVIWMVSLSLSIIAFVLEWIFTIKDVFLFKYIFDIFCHVNVSNFGFKPLKDFKVRKNQPIRKHIGFDDIEELPEI